MYKRKISGLVLIMLLFVAYGIVRAQFPVTVTDQTPTVPLANPTPSSYQPRYSSGFGSDNTFTIFFEDRDATPSKTISFVQTTTGPTGFPTSATATNIVETHFVVKDWPINISGTDYAYRGWGSNDPAPGMDMGFYVSNDLVNWTLAAAFTITRTDPWANGTVAYGFHDVILINGTHYAWGETNRGETVLVSSANGDHVWTYVASMGSNHNLWTTGGGSYGPLVTPTDVSAPNTGWTPSGSFFDLGHDRGYGKIYFHPNDKAMYLAINTAAKASLTPAAFEAAFNNPANWTWHDGNIGKAASPIISKTTEHNYLEGWLVPTSNPDAGWQIIYDADYGIADGGRALGYTLLTPPSPPPVHNITQGTDYNTIMAAVNAANPGDIIVADAGTYPERVTITKSLTIRGAQNGVDPTQTGARTDPSAESIIDITGLSVTNPNVAVEIPGGVTNVILEGFTVKGSPTFNYADESVFRIWDDNITIQDNIIDGFYGILFKGSDNLTAQRNRITVNKAGITVQPFLATNVTIADNLISLGSNPAADAAGIYLTSTSNSTVIGNTATGFTGSRAIHGSNLDHLTVSGNDFSGNKDAISFWGNTTFITITENNLSNNSRYGINIKGQDIEITKNQITNNGDMGITIDKHTLTTERVKVNCNDIFGNTNYGLFVNTTNVSITVDAENNWWGHVSGPTHASNPGGSGDDVTDNVDFVPWLATPWQQDNTCNPPTAINLSSFYAFLVDDMVQIYWSTATEPNNVGFNIYRAREAAGDYQKINDHLIMAEGDATTGASYSYNDRPPQADTYYYKLQDVSIDGQTTFHGPIQVAGVTSVEDGAVINTDKYQLFQNHPNPFNPNTEIRFSIPNAGHVSIKIYDMKGQLVRTVVSERKAAGSYSVSWDSRDENGVKVTSGVYFYRIDAGEFNMTKKMILMK